jgi:hypothetical protein
MTTLQRVDKEDLVEGKSYLFTGKYRDVFGEVSGGFFLATADTFGLPDLNGQFYGPIELEVE